MMQWDLQLTSLGSHFFRQASTEATGPLAEAVEDWAETATARALETRMVVKRILTDMTVLVILQEKKK